MKIRKVQQKSIYFEMFEFDWMELDKDNEFYLLENKHEIEAVMALKENTEEKFLSIILIEVKHKNIGKRVRVEDNKEKNLNEDLEQEDTTQKEPQTESQEEPQEEIQIEEEQQSDAEQKSEEETDSKDDKSDKKKSFFGKKDNKLQDKVDELEDRVKRQMAEFETFRKRTDKEKTAMFETGAKSVIEKILPVVDNFERGLAGLSEEEKKQPFAEGMAMVYKQLMTELDKLEVKPIEAVGCEFDPNLHNAVMQVESDEYESGIIAQELQKGYTYRDTVVRHSMVAVVQ